MSITRTLPSTIARFRRRARSPEVPIVCRGVHERRPETHFRPTPVAGQIGETRERRRIGELDDRSGRLHAVLQAGTPAVRKDNLPLGPRCGSPRQAAGKQLGMELRTGMAMGGSSVLIMIHVGLPASVGRLPSSYPSPLQQAEGLKWGWSFPFASHHAPK